MNSKNVKQDVLRSVLMSRTDLGKHLDNTLPKPAGSAFGTLSIVATPIGNMQDITIRALHTLFSVDLILTENVVRTQLLLSTLKKRYPSLIKGQTVEPKCVLFNEFAENQKLHEYLLLLEEGLQVALVSEAGTPTISDPGYKLVREAIKEEIPVRVVPGPCAAISALVVSGLPPHSFLFLGFLPRGEKKKKDYLLSLKNVLLGMQRNSFYPTVIFFESPHRIIETLEMVDEVFGDIPLVIVRELTKKFEQVLRKSSREVLARFSKTKPKGEFTILFNVNISNIQGYTLTKV